MRKNLKVNNIMDKFLVIFLLIQPIFDVKFFYNSISTLIRVIIIFSLTLFYFFRRSEKGKFKFLGKWQYVLLAYPILFGVYFIFHHINALNFTSLVPGNFNYSVIKEFLYFVKMFSPFLLIYCIYKSSISRDNIINIMKSLVLIITLVIVISNLFVFSYGSYSDSIIKDNFFGWFTQNSGYNYKDLASKWLFEYGNQIGAILIMFLPFMIYLVFKECNFINCFTLFFNVFALFLLCTRVSVLGVFVVLIYTVFTFAFIYFIQKQHFSIKKFLPIGLVLIVYSTLLPINPMFNRIDERNTVIETFRESVADESIPSEVETPTVVSDSRIKYIEETYEKQKLHKQFLFENYPYTYDPDFWYDFLHKDISLTTNYRYIEKSIIQRVVEINNNPLDKWLGITNTRLQNIFNIERDFVVQYYALGIIGTILVFAPYFALLSWFAYVTILNKFRNLDVVNTLAFITIVFLLGISYMSGNLLNSLSFTIYFTLCFDLLVKKESGTVGS